MHKLITINGDQFSYYYDSLSGGRYRTTIVHDSDGDQIFSVAGVQSEEHITNLIAIFYKGIKIGEKVGEHRKLLEIKKVLEIPFSFQNTENN